MKSEVINNSESKKIEFPCLMKSNTNENLIVLFTKIECGTVVSQTKVYDLGYVSEDWEMKYFTEFKGKVILSND